MSGEGRRVGAVLLAAGESRRFGDHNKLLADFEGRPMLRHVARVALASDADPIVAVTGHDQANVDDVLADLPLQRVYNADYAQGMSTSLRVGVAAMARCSPPVGGALICLADMPWVGADHLNALIEAFNPEAGRQICVPVFDRRRGNPILWAASYFDEIRRVTGDIGARGLLAAHADQVHEVPFDDAGVRRDVDARDQL